MDTPISDDRPSATPLASLVRPSAAVVVGASGGIGQAFVRALLPAGFTHVHALSRSGVAVEGAVTGTIDLLDEASIAAAAARVEATMTMAVR